ncbi:MAG TPA: zf-HC2 domain-containing protein [Thermoanaerobaculaceae bacterium]|nr:zf-HC2 domain-containing protein [Thermoanaerobaculaceae bacterium]
MREADHHQRIHAYLDGELDAAGLRAVEAHLAGCRACREALAAARALGEALGATAPPLAPAFVAATRARALGRGLPLAPLWWRGLPVAWRAGMAALAAVALVVGAQLGREVAADRAAAADLAAALDAPATAALLAEAPPAATGTAR